MRFPRYFFLLLLAVFPSLALAQREKLPPEDLATVEQMFPNAKRTSTSLRYVVVKEGTGENPKPGDLVDVLYVGKLLNGTVFDQAQNPEKPFSVRLGRGNVIEGWEEGLQLMKVGEKRILIVPFELAYGTRGQPPKIPRRATLVFEVELLAIRK
jgi:FKBP-type peptidyl-prolyl cis-trans isomerase